MKLRTAIIFSFLIGLMDALTGIFLVFFPIFTLKLMGVPAAPNELVYLQYVGVFVFGVGASYWYPLVVGERNRKIESIYTTWRFTMFTRCFVGTFVLVQIFQRHLVFAWISVPLTDLSLAIIQFFLLRQGIKENDQ